MILLLLESMISVFYKLYPLDWLGKSWLWTQFNLGQALHQKREFWFSPIWPMSEGLFVNLSNQSNSNFICKCSNTQGTYYFHNFIHSFNKC